MKALGAYDIQIFPTITSFQSLKCLRCSILLRASARRLPARKLSLLLRHEQQIPRYLNGKAMRMCERFGKVLACKREALIQISNSPLSLTKSLQSPARILQVARLVLQHQWELVIRLAMGSPE